MPSVDTLLNAWVWLAIPLVLLTLYLTVNKIWIRRHEPVVTESISVAAKLLAVIAALPYILMFIIHGPIQSAVKTTLVIAADLFLILIGIGFWVQSKRSRGLWANLKSALRLERKEATTLLRDVFHPIAAKQLIQILCDFAMIDRELDARERDFIQGFASRWRIDFDSAMANTQQNVESGGPAAFVRLRQSLIDYLELSPPKEQAHQLGEVLSLLAAADKKTAVEEELMLDELLGLIEDYISHAAAERFLVLIAPQNPTQLEALKSTHPEWPQQHRLGGEVLLCGSYFSSAYAEMVCDLYRQSGYLTITASENAATVANTNS